MASSNLYDQRYRNVQSSIDEFRNTRQREQDRNRPLTFLEHVGLEEDSDKDRLDALKLISNLYSDPAYPLRGRITRNTQEQAEQIRNFLRGVSEDAAAGETGMADRVIDRVSAGDFGFESIGRLQNPQEFLQDSIGPISVTTERRPGPSINVASVADAPVPGAGNAPVDVAGVADAPVDAMSGRSLLRRALEASRTPIDMQRFKQLAQDRQRAGDLSMITSLAAGEAGPRYSGYQESYLKKALGEKGAQQLGDYGFASGGEFYETPGIQQAREQEADLAASKLLFDAESDAAKALGKTLTANQYSKLMSEVDTDEIALNQLDEILETFKTEEGGVDRGISVWADQVSANVKTFFGVPANQEEYRLASRKAKLQQIIGLFRTEIVGPGVVTEYDAQRILDSVGGDVGALQNPDIVKEQLAILRSQKLKTLITKKRQLEYFGARGFEGLYDPGLSLSTQPLSGSPSIPSDTAASGAGQETYEVDF